MDNLISHNWQFYQNGEQKLSWCPNLACSGRGWLTKGGGAGRCKVIPIHCSCHHWAPVRSPGLSDLAFPASLGPLILWSEASAELLWYWIFFMRRGTVQTLRLSYHHIALRLTIRSCTTSAQPTLLDVTHWLCNQTDPRLGKKSNICNRNLITKMDNEATAQSINWHTGRRQVLSPLSHVFLRRSFFIRENLTCLRVWCEWQRWWWCANRQTSLGWSDTQGGPRHVRKLHLLIQPLLLRQDLHVVVFPYTP